MKAMVVHWERPVHHFEILKEPCEKKEQSAYLFCIWPLQLGPSIELSTARQ